MRRPDCRKACLLLALLLCLSLFSVPSFAAYESDESGGTEPPEYIGSVITITSEEMGDMPDPEPCDEPLVEPDPEPDGDMDALLESLFALLLSGDLSGLTDNDALTPEGNMTLIDDMIQGYGEESKQFLTVNSKNGNTFYLVIDRSGKQNNVHFLNQVDEADLMALMEDGEAEVKPAVCSCKDRCYAGHVDTTCEICAVNMAACAGKAPEPTPTPMPEPETEKPEKKSTSGAAVLLLIVVLAGGAAFYFFKVKGMSLPFEKAKPSGGSSGEAENEEADDDFLEFEKSDEPEDDLEPFQPDNGEYWPEDEKGGTAK